LLFFLLQFGNFLEWSNLNQSFVPFEEYIEVVNVCFIFFLLYIINQNFADYEYTQLQKHIFNQEKIASLQILAGGLAHDYNNIVQIIQSNVDYLKNYNLSPEERQETIKDLESALSGAKNLNNKIMLLSGTKRPQEYKKVNLLEILRKSTSYIAPSSKIVIKLKDLENLYIKADPMELSRVFQNLLFNSLQAMKNEGIITISMKVPSSPPILSQFLKYQDYVLISVEDDGEGIPKDIVNHIFDPFFTTKPNGKGLGLTIVNRIIKDHEGSIFIESQVGKGTKIKIYLPLL
jgi:signal transduction histidine kinase